MKFVYPAIFEPLEDYTSYEVTFPDLKGVVVRGSSISDAIINAQNAAAERMLNEMRGLNESKGGPPPIPSNIKSIKISGEQFTSLIMFDMDEYYVGSGGDKIATITCNIPGWLEDVAEMKNVDYAQVLQDALIDRLIRKTPYTKE